MKLQPCKKKQAAQIKKKKNRHTAADAIFRMTVNVVLFKTFIIAIRRRINRKFSYISICTYYVLYTSAYFIDIPRRVF